MSFLVHLAHAYIDIYFLPPDTKTNYVEIEHVGRCPVTGAYGMLQIAIMGTQKDGSKSR